MERIDTLKQSGLQIIQNPDFFCFGIDAILLSNFCKIEDGENVCDLGTGNGIIPILLSAKIKSANFTGLEIQSVCADMASRSVKKNNLENRIKIILGDIKNYENIFSKNSFDSVISNPPYMISSHGKGNQNELKSCARHEIFCSLDDIVKCASNILKPRGKFFMIHKPFRLAEIFSTLVKYNLEPKRMQLVYPFVNKEPTMVLIESRKNAKSRITVMEPLIVYETPGEYTKKIKEIYES